jgi:hypothetical protein
MYIGTSKYMIPTSSLIMLTSQFITIFILLSNKAMLHYKEIKQYYSSNSGLLGYDTMYSCRWLSTFLRNIIITQKTTKFHYQENIKFNTNTNICTCMKCLKFLCCSRPAVLKQKFTITISNSQYHFNKVNVMA